MASHVDHTHHVHQADHSHQSHHAKHAHHSHHDHKDSDYGPMYELDWVKNVLHHIKLCVESNSNWLGIDPNEPQRILDYACGNGIISRTLVTKFPNARFQGIDLSNPQVDRFNREVRDMGDEYGQRMYAVQGDIMDPAGPIELAEWYGFDVAVVSMALHHMKDPIRFLDTLRQRVRQGGTIVVIDWLQSPDGCLDDDDVDSQSKSDDKYNQQAMITVKDGNLKIWPGFSDKDIKEDMQAAGCEDVDVVEYPERIETPSHMQGYNRLFIAKAGVK